MDNKAPQHSRKEPVEQNKEKNTQMLAQKTFPSLFVYKSDKVVQFST